MSYLLNVSNLLFTNNKKFFHSSTFHVNNLKDCSQDLNAILRKSLDPLACLCDLIAVVFVFSYRDVQMYFSCVLAMIASDNKGFSVAVTVFVESDYLLRAAPPAVQ